MRLRTPSPPRMRPHWGITLYPEAGEGGGCLRVVRRREFGSGVYDPDRAAEEANRRARARIRRYCAANRLNRMATLTYAGSGCRDPKAVRSDVAEFFRRLRGKLGGDPFPYLWVPQWHPGGHGLHVHFAVGRYVRQSLIRDEWGHGHTSIKLIGDLPVGSGKREEARVVARYVSSYVGRDVDADRAGRLHRYEVAQGFQPAGVYCMGNTAERAIAEAAEVMGGPPSVVWHSSSLEAWSGPPACWVSW